MGPPARAWERQRSQRDWASPCGGGVRLRFRARRSRRLTLSRGGRTLHGRPCSPGIKLKWRAATSVQENHVFARFSGFLWQLGSWFSCFLFIWGWPGATVFSRKRAKNELSRLGIGPHLGVGHAHPSQRSFKKRVFSEGNRHFSAAGRSPNPILSRPELILSHSKSISLSFLTSSLLVFSRFFHLCSYDQYEPLRCRAWASSGSGALLRRCAAPPRPPSRHARPKAATPGPAGPPAAARRCTTPPHPSLEMGRAHCQSASFQEAQGCTAQAAGRSELDRRNAERAPPPPPPGSTPTLRAPVLPKCTALAPQPPRASKRRRIRRPDPAPFRPRRRRAGRP